jgi:UDP-N-acetylmuramate dehydrogenase
MTNIKKKLPGIQKNISLKKYTTFNIGGPTRYFLVAKNEEEIKKAVKTAKELNLEYFILGGGSNILISHKGFDGLVIKVESRKSKVESQTIYAEAGVNLGKLVKFSIENNLSGLEWAAGIPGTLGGAIRGNAGAFGKSMADIIQEVTTLNKDLRFTIYDLPASNASLARNAVSTAGRRSDTGRRNIKYGYRDSIFKRNQDIILSAILKLEKDDSKIFQKKIQEYLKKRKSTQPLEYPSAGSIFKNPKYSEKYPELKKFSKCGIIPVGWLIESVGLKGKKIGGAQISKKHSNFIINTGNARAEDVVILISLVKQKVRNKFGLQLMEEIEYIGF